MNIDLEKIQRIILELPGKMDALTSELASVKAELARLNRGSGVPSKPLPKNRKNEVSERTFSEKAPIILGILLQGGQYQSVGASQLELERAIQKSADTVHRITKKLHEMGILKVKRRGGGNPTYYSILRGKETAARELAQNLEETDAHNEDS
jgi:hypothetical protein